jgi:hypothetical protein
MPKRSIFYSFHYDNDVNRVQLIRNIGALEGNEPATPNQWEEVKRGGEAGIKRWIDSNMNGKSCLVVLIGEQTANRKWVRYEIEKAWNEGKGVIGIYIHNIKCMKNGYCLKGNNPFDYVRATDGRLLSTLVKTYTPSATDAYNDIRSNIEVWIENAIADRKK